MPEHATLTTTFTGGSAQNTARVAQWLQQQQGVTTFMGSVGDDEPAALMGRIATATGLNAQYQARFVLQCGAQFACVGQSASLTSLLVAD